MANEILITVRLSYEANAVGEIAKLLNASSMVQAFAIKVPEAMQDALGNKTAAA